jgi:hypothetical protein
VAHCEIPRKEGGPKASNAVHSPLGFKFHPLQKATAIVDCLENLLTPVTCVTKTMNGGWCPEFKLCSKLQETTPFKEYDHVTYRN